MTADDVILVGGPHDGQHVTTAGSDTFIVPCNEAVSALTWATTAIPCDIYCRQQDGRFWYAGRECVSVRLDELDK